MLKKGAGDNTLPALLLFLRRWTDSPPPPFGNKPRLEDANAWAQVLSVQSAGEMGTGRIQQV